MVQTLCAIKGMCEYITIMVLVMIMQAYYIIILV